MGEPPLGFCHTEGLYHGFSRDAIGAFSLFSCKNTAGLQNASLAVFPTVWSRNRECRFLRSSPG